MRVPSGIFSTGLTTNAFDTHVALITEAILDRISDLMATDGGILISSTAETDLQVVDAGGGVVNIRAGNAYDKFGQRLSLATDDTASGLLVGSVDLSSGVDLSVNPNIKIDIDDAGSVEIDCSANAVTPATTTIDEILAEINAAGFGTIAFRADAGGNPVTTGGYILVKSSITGGSSEVEFIAPSGNDATNEIFGLSEGAYPHTFNGGGGYQIPDDSTSYDVLIEYLDVESNVGNFDGGYPSAGDSQYTQRNDSYTITVQLSSVGIINDADQQEILLAEVSNTGGTLTITDKRGDSIIALRGQKQTDTTPPAAPVFVSLTQSAITGGALGSIQTQANIIPRWESVTDASGIREYIVRLVLTERDGNAVQSADPQEYTLQSFDILADELQLTIPVPLGDKYDVSVAAKDNSLSQNISPFTLLGNIQAGSGADADAVEMPAITLYPITNGVRVDWPDAPVPITAYEIAVSYDRNRPRFDGPNTFSTLNSEYVVSAAPGQDVQVEVRIRRTNMTLSATVQNRAVAGGTVIGLNEKTLPESGLSVAKTDDGIAARFLTRIYLPNPAAIVKLAVDVSNYASNSSSRGVVRVYRDNQESGAVHITFNADGQHEVNLDKENNFTAGWLVVDAYDSQSSGSDQAEFTTDLVVVYAEGQIVTEAQQTKPGINL